ncbi:Nin one binding Zn-ribbon like-domain-containing protein [Vararia minispora EC-137]|uniref:Nin one binding Zn-ribbon like-domain-containing protein n=1 Tax=Vararia minispora EC-137 TaxID=1314806 RepID=A0ACB8QXI9_9AGAM|nr:Nin one binding Zn-ribbon like-domain-containing protein [Vararia minispora EC-137]
MASSSNPACRLLVLDAGPLLSLSPLRGLAETYVTVPQVLDELKDKRAREHFEKLALTAGVNVKVQSPDAASLAHVVQFAKKTGDYSVLSNADLAVLALTYALDTQAKGDTDNEKGKDEKVREDPVDASPDPSSDSEEDDAPDVSRDEHPPENVDEERHEADEEYSVAADDGDLVEREPLDIELQPLPKEDDTRTPASIPPHASSPPAASDALIFEDPSDSDDGEGEWITPSNVGLHKSKALGLTLSAANSKARAIAQTLPVGCMTVDFAMQNVLLQMGLSLVGVEGKRIDKVKTWVLRCHACFKICKDNSKTFCPACGNPALLRTSVTVSSPGATGKDQPAMKVHLKKNFQYRTRGTIYSIPAPKPGSAKTGSGEGLILREDQAEYMRAVKRADAKKQRDEKRMLSSGAQGIGNWMDPDWVPQILTVGASGKGRKTGRDELPAIGYGRRNPNERKHRKK